MHGYRGHLARNISAVAGLIVLLVFSSAAIAGNSYKDTPDGRWAEPSGYYIEGRFGGPINGVYEVNMRSANVPGANGELEIDTGQGLGGGLAIGKQFSRLWRGEFSWGYAVSNDLEVDFSGAPANPLAPATLTAAGEMSAHTLMVSLIRSWDYEFFGRVRPFSGAGIGVAIIDVDQVAPATARFMIDDTDTVFVAALHSGFDVTMTDMTVFTFRINTILTTGGTFNAIDTFNAGGIMSVKSDTDITTGISVGIRVKLN